MTHKVKSPLAGSIMGIYVDEGERVSIGTEVLAVESMKMLFPIESPVDGTLVQVLVQAGEIVAEGETLYIVEVN